MTDNGRKELFVRTVREHSHSMYCVAMSMLHSPADAEDAVSEAVETAWRHLWTLRDPEALPAYLTRCTVNACHAALRRRKRETVTEDMEPYCAPAEDETPLWEYIGQLPEKFRTPLVLKYGENMTVEEIAAALGILRGTASSRLTRGLQLLREQMKGED